MSRSMRVTRSMTSKMSPNEKERILETGIVITQAQKKAHDENIPVVHALNAGKHDAVDTMYELMKSGQLRRIADIVLKETYITDENRVVIEKLQFKNPDILTHDSPSRTCFFMHIIQFGRSDFWMDFITRFLLIYDINATKMVSKLDDGAVHTLFSLLLYQYVQHKQNSNIYWNIIKRYVLADYNVNDLYLGSKLVPKTITGKVYGIDANGYVIDNVWIVNHVENDKIKYLLSCGMDITKTGKSGVTILDEISSKFKASREELADIMKAIEEVEKTIKVMKPEQKAFPNFREMKLAEEHRHRFSIIDLNSMPTLTDPITKERMIREEVIKHHSRIAEINRQSEFDYTSPPGLYNMLMKQEHLVKQKSILETQITKLTEIEKMLAATTKKNRGK